MTFQYDTSRHLDLQSRLSLPKVRRLFRDGRLNVEPVSNKLCVSYRFRGMDGYYTTNEAIHIIKHKADQEEEQTLKLVRVGLIFLEDIERFIPVRIEESGNRYHFFHFIEMIVIAYVELHGISRSLLTDELAKDTSTPISDGSPKVAVPWIFSPHMSPSEIAGGSMNLNGLVADFAFGVPGVPWFRRREGIVGLDDMEYYPFNYTNQKEKGVERRLELAQIAYGGSPSFADDVDVVLQVERSGCDNARINKPWSKFIDDFPAETWHSSIMKHLKNETANQKHESSLIVVGYIDRQNTDRRLLDEHHEWVVQYLAYHPDVDFLHLHMENYSPQEQIAIASRCDMIVGVHGNGLTHSLWMSPHRYVIEFFYRFNYQFDYSTTAQLLQHKYLGIIDGVVVDSEKVSRRDPSLRQHPTRQESLHKPRNDTLVDFEDQAKPAIRKFVENAIQELRNSMQ